MELSLLADCNKKLIKEIEENTIEQIRNLLNYLENTDLFINKDILKCQDIFVR